MYPFTLSSAKIYISIDTDTISIVNNIVPRYTKHMAGKNTFSVNSTRLFRQHMSRLNKTEHLMLHPITL